MRILTLDLLSCVFLLTNNGIVIDGAKPQVYDNHSVVIVQQSANSGKKKHSFCTIFTIPVHKPI